jgi:hypothetical protein
MVYRLKGTSGAVINQSFPLQGRITIGVGEGFDVPVEGAEGQTLLAVIEVSDQAVNLRAEADSGVTVNGETVMELDLAGGDELRAGRSRLILQAPGLRPERVLTEEAVRSGRPQWPWWLAAALLTGAAALAWQQGWLSALLPGTTGY